MKFDGRQFMKELQLATTMLEKIIDENKNFQEVIKEVFPPNSSDKQYLGSVCAFVGCELRHHALIKEACKNIQGLNNNQSYVLYLALANNAFLKKFDPETMINETKNALLDKYVSEIDDLFANCQDLIATCKDLHVDSIDYIATRFNTPRWLVNMWKKHFGRAVMFKILRKNNRQQIQTVRINTKKTTTEKFLNAHPDEFKKTDIEDVIIYNGKGQVRKTPYFRNFEIFNERLPIKIITDKVFDLDMGECLLISAENDSIVKELYLKAKPSVGIHVAVPTLDKRPELIKLMRNSKQKNISIFNAPTYLDIQAAVNHRQDLAIVYPESSSFDLIRQYPDYLLHFDYDRLDYCLSKQKEALEGANMFLNEGSKLVYIVNTLNKKESRGTISNFLKEHPNYEIIEEKQYFPFDEYDTALYYCILLKKDIFNPSND